MSDFVQLVELNFSADVLLYLQKVETKPAVSSPSSRSGEPKVNLPPPAVAAAPGAQTVARVEVAGGGVGRPGAPSPPAGSAAPRSPDPSAPPAPRPRPPPRLILGEKAMTVQAQPLPYIPGLTVPDNLGSSTNSPLSQFPSHLPYLMDSALLQELQQLRQLHADRTSNSTATKCESKSVQSRGTSPIVIGDDTDSETPRQSSVKVTTSTSTETEPLVQQPAERSRRESSTTAVQTTPSVEDLQQQQQQQRAVVSTVEQSVQTCTECSQIHQAAQELLSIGSRRSSGNNNVDAADIEVQGICAGHALRDSSPTSSIVFSPPHSEPCRPAVRSARSLSAVSATSHHTPRTSTASGQQRDLSYLEPELCQVSDGLELLSVLAEHAQKQTHSSEEEDEEGEEEEGSESENSAAAVAADDDDKSQKTDRSESPPVFAVPWKTPALARVRGLSNPDDDDDEPLPMNSPSRLEGYEIPDINKNYNAPKSLLHDKQGGFSGKLFGFKKETAGLLAETTFKYPDGKLTFISGSLPVLPV